ncbi:DUF6221 family protein [Sphaerisporangium sp. TRM90804]|uniref:DUF6221 family protein n=1 Tax=Sphaerisporangium sp. TRM90804 TaxID=3031113 RepID=UPI002447DC4D|nr:DUF6221 family protein [Sphaerisporangium sp. TRM90804]MDH2429596.1 DUF6221 family protein [Sphaerisporangium sp. TRM90804]
MEEIDPDAEADPRIDLVLFLRARWAEEEAELARLTRTRPVQDYLRRHAGRLRADLAAKRALADALERLLSEEIADDLADEDLSFRRPGEVAMAIGRLSEVLAMAVHFAGQYEGHEGFDKRWEL